MIRKYLLLLVPIALLIGGSLGCAAFASKDRGGEVHFSDPTPPRAKGEFPNWPITPERSEEILRHGEMELESAEYAGAGVTGAMKVELVTPSGKEFTAKWKEMPRGKLDGINNSPRKEIAAYEIQRLFLDPEDYVVPTSVARCTPLERYSQSVSNSKPSVADTSCVLGVLSIWMKDVTVPAVLYDGERFRQEYAYASFMSDFNLLTYLISHKDGRKGNFLVSKDDAKRQVFAIDNGVSLSGIWFNWFVPNWNSIRIPAVRRESIDRLRKVKREDLEFLGVLLQFEADENGQLRPVEPGKNLDPDEGVRVENGTVQLGLKESELDDIWEDLEDLLEDIDDGEIDLF